MRIQIKLTSISICCLLLTVESLANKSSEVPQNGSAQEQRVFKSKKDASSELKRDEQTPEQRVFVLDPRSQGGAPSLNLNQGSTQTQSGHTPVNLQTGGADRGGQGYVVGPTGKVDVGDSRVRFLEVDELNPELMSLLWRASSLLTVYGLDRINFFNEYVLNPRVKYELVDQLSCRTDMKMETSAEEKTGTLGCTLGDHTELLRSIFLSKNFNKYGFIASLVHERLHALPNHPDHSDIIKITAGLRRALELQDLQNAGDRRVLSSSDVHLLNRMVRSIQNLGLTKTSSGDVFQIHPKGGGLIGASAWVHRNAFVGIGSKIDSESALEDASVVINANLHCVQVALGVGAELRQINIASPENCPSSYSDTTQSRISLGTGAKIEFSQMRAAPMTITSRSNQSRKPVILKLSMGRESLVKNVTWEINPLTNRGDRATTLKLIVEKSAQIADIAPTTLILGELDHQGSIVTGPAPSSTEKTIVVPSASKVDGQGHSFFCRWNSPNQSSGALSAGTVKSLKSNPGLLLLKEETTLQKIDDLATICWGGTLTKDF